ncbi:hypothetical protein FH972_023180 [Carpinus fangiana]|uniref:Peptidase S53 domain-containing protein n=1 Tax=Carpinus fangiana TaxID=176857 RepID=A0A5N6KUR9_9ROSI|nr:hypothetical protein FH972_023180 [Carpinus fangiana]
MRLSIIGFLAVGAIAAPAGHVLHEKREFLSANWQKKHAIESRALMPMRIGLTQQNLDQGHDLLMDVSDHTSPNYGKHYTPEEIADIFAPSQNSVDAVTAWLTSAGIARDRISQSWNRQWIQFDALAHEAEDLLKTKYHVYEHTEFGTGNIACDEYHVPAHIQEHVDYITPGIKLFATKPKSTGRDGLQKRTFGVTGKAPVLPPLMKPLPQPLASLKALSLDLICGVAIIPECISAMYNITKATKAAPNNKLGIFEALGDVYSQEDLNLFFATLASNIPQGTHPELRAIDGATAPNPVLTAGPESDLDFEISYPIIYPQGSVLFQTDDDVYQANYTYEGFFNNFLDAIDGSYCSYSAYGETGNDPKLDPSYPHNVPGGYKGNLQCGKYKPTNVISISYGGQEPDLPAYYQKRQCNEFLKLGMQGISVLIASGDSGVSGRPVTGDNGCLGPNMTVFNPGLSLKPFPPS